MPGLAKKAARLTAMMPVGTVVQYRVWSVQDSPKTGTIREPFSVLGGHTVVAWIEGVRGCIAADRVTKGGGA